jgi:hypothetical protein
MSGHGFTSAFATELDAPNVISGPKSKPVINRWRANFIMGWLSQAFELWAINGTSPVAAISASAAAS